MRIVLDQAFQCSHIMQSVVRKELQKANEEKTLEDREREMDRQRQNLIARALYPLPPHSWPTILHRAEGEWLVLVFCGQKKSFLKNQQVLWTSLFRLGWKRPLVTGPSLRQRKSIEIRTKGVGAQSSACKKKKQKMVLKWWLLYYMYYKYICSKVLD